MTLNNIYIIGLGLIGGSFAKAIKKLYPKTTIYGIDENSAHLETALQLGLINEKASIEQLKNADLVVLSVPVHAAVEMLPNILETIAETTLIFDVGSTKKDICKAVENHPKRRNFLATHPIAGTEFSGPNSALETLFYKKTNILCEIEKTAFPLQEKARELFKNLGMRIRYMHPEAHDKHIAYVSHLSHISSFMLGKTVIEKEKNERDIFDMAGSGFASTVRLAKSSPEMWSPIFQQNKENILESLEEYISNLNAFKSLMENDNFDAIYKEMKNTNYIKEILKGIQ